MNLKALYQISYGLYIISSKKEDKINGQIANTVFQITSEPPTVAVSINKRNLTHEFIMQSKVFCVSVLEKTTPLSLIGQFGFKTGREVDKFSGLNYKTGKTGASILLENTIGYLEFEVIKTIDVETHTIFIGKLVDADVIKSGEPMTYAYYHEIKGGKAPKTAPTFIKEEKKGEASMQRYKCSICGYIYDPEKGDPDSGIKPGTPFESLPDSWVCPICGAKKEKFEKEG